MYPPFFFLILQLKAKLFLKDLKSYGNTIVITGCTDGIGKSLTYALAKQNVNLLLISRNEKELKSIKKDLLEINKNCQRTIDYIVFDYNEHKFSSYKSMQDKLQKIDVGILINNVGISYPNPLVQKNKNKKYIAVAVAVIVHLHTFNESHMH